MKKKSGAGAGKKFAGSPALHKSNYIHICHLSNVQEGIEHLLAAVRQALRFYWDKGHRLIFQRPPGPLIVQTMLCWNPGINRWRQGPAGLWTRLTQGGPWVYRGGPQGTPEGLGHTRAQESVLQTKTSGFQR